MPAMSIVANIVSKDFSKRIFEWWIESYCSFYRNEDWQLLFNNAWNPGSGTYPAYLASELIYILHWLRVWVVIENWNMENNNKLFHKVQYDILQWFEVAEVVGENLCHILSNILLRYLELKKWFNGSQADQWWSQTSGEEQVQ